MKWTSCLLYKLMSSAGETSAGYLESSYFLSVFTSWSRSSMPAIILFLEWQRNVWPIWNAAEPCTSFISALRNVCWVNFQHQSWMMGGEGTGGILSFAVCLHTLLLDIADELSEIRGTHSLWEWPVVGCALMQQSITFPSFRLPSEADILFMNSREQVSHIRFYMCGC